MKSPYHTAYIFWSAFAAVIALAGTLADWPILYATVPGIIGGSMAALASWRFCMKKQDLAGFIATICGFIYYQEFQANPVTLPDFSASLVGLAMQDKALGLFLANLTTAMLLISCHIMSNWLHGTIGKWTPDPARVSRPNIDRKVMIGFWIVFAVVALPNVLFGKVVVGAIDNVLYQRMVGADPDNYSGFAAGGGALGASAVNLALWATSLFLIWLYLLRSRYWLWMLILAPLILLWTASVLMQGTRTPLVTVGMATVVYLFGNPKSRKQTILYALVFGPVLFLSLQIATYFRGSGLQAVNLPELSSHLLEIRGNEGTSSQIDGLEFFRTQYVEKKKGPNPVVGIFRGLVGRPIESLLMPVPRTLFPWKANDLSAGEFNLWYCNVRQGLDVDVATLGASPGLIGRELIKYGLFGPFTLFFWLGLLLALADRLFATGMASDFHRIFAALLIAYIIAQARDFVPLWFTHFFPAGVVFGLVARQARKKQPVRSGLAQAPQLNSASQTMMR